MKMNHLFPSNYFHKYWLIRFAQCPKDMGCMDVG